MKDQSVSGTLESLLEVMALLRHPEKGCAWDLEQDASTLIRYTIEEAYEVADAIDRGNWDDLRNELGDLLLQVVFYAQVAKDEGHFDFYDVVHAITEKIVARNQGIFGSETITTSEDQQEHWDEIKAKERAMKSHHSEGMLADIPNSYPALLRGYKLIKRISEDTGICFSNEDILEKIHEEAGEVMEASSFQEKEEEFGDLLLAMCKAAYTLGIDPEEALRKANVKLARRVESAESIARASHTTIKGMREDEWKALWKQVKENEKAASG